MKNIHIPYNNDLGLIDSIYNLGIDPNLYQIVFYFAPSPNITKTGRRLPNYENYIMDGKFNDVLFEDMIMKMLEKCKQYGFQTNMLLNSVTLGLPYSNNDLKNNIPKIQHYLEKLDSTGLVHLTTVGNPYLLDLLNWNKLKNINIKTSVNFQIKDYKSIELLENILKYWVNHKKLKEIEIQKDLLRDLDALSKIKAKTKNLANLSIIMNEACLTGCPYQLSHQIHSSTIPNNCIVNYDNDFEFGIAKCKLMTAAEPWRFLDSNWILPRHLHLYEDLVDTYKFVGRNDSTEIITNTIKAYILKDYDKTNLNKLFGLMNMEKWKFPEEFLPEDFDSRIFSDEDNKDYFINIWKNIVEYNRKLGINATFGLKGLWKDNLHKFENI